VVAVIFDVVVSICGCLGSTVAAAVTAGIGSLLSVCLIPLFFVPWAVSIYYGIQAYQGKYVEVPYLTKFMTQQGWL
jgi:antibiotic biosynthesis monooxygenase (ABM) superfamily enzyme